MIRIKTINKAAKYSVFKSKVAKNDEYFLSINPENSDFSKALKEVNKCYLEFLKKTGLSPESQVFCRFFLSDIANQKDLLLASDLLKKEVKGSYSIIGETPTSESKILMFSYHIGASQNKKEKLKIGDGWTNGIKTIGENFDLIHISNMIEPSKDGSEKQTRSIFSRYASLLKKFGCALKNNCVRTWIFVRDIDNHYGGMVKARREFFEKHGLRKDTRSIASTGIDGKSKEINLLVSMDAIAISKIKPEQIKRMEAKSHLNSTYEYGVTFERGLKVEFGDRSHLYLSGTASINNKGEIIHPQNIEKQTLRTLENMGALLKPHKAGLSDLMYLIVYVRSITDALAVQKMINKKGLGKLPTFFVEGAVCRPGWMVEMEGTAIIENKLKWPDFL